MSVQAPLPEIRSQENPPFYRDVNTLRWLIQIGALAVVIAVTVYLLTNVKTNLEDAGLPTGFQFLQGKFGSKIDGLEDSADFAVWQAFGAGYLNTVRIIMFGIPGCTILGIIIGVMRLSKNAAARTFGTIYVETFRNIPALVWIFIFHFALMIGRLPSLDERVNPLGLAVISVKGLAIPWLNPDASRWVFAAFIILAFVAAYFMGIFRGKVNERTGEPARGGLYSTAAFFVVLIIGHFVAGMALNLEAPGIDDSGNALQLADTGMIVAIPYASITIALTLYTASHVAEIVRGAILSIHKGQGEAASAIALTNIQRYRFVILPQAFRIMIPPLANQYLNITKNSSLAVAFSYFEIAKIFSIVVNNAAPAVQGVVVLMVLYLSFSLSISFVANMINRRLQLVTR